VFFVCCWRGGFGHAGILGVHKCAAKAIPTTHAKSSFPNNERVTK
jgi:hypothetical protein